MSGMNKKALLAAALTLALSLPIVIVWSENLKFREGACNSLRLPDSTLKASP